MTTQMPPSINGWVGVARTTLGEALSGSVVLLHMADEWRVATVVGEVFTGESRPGRWYRRLRRMDMPPRFVTASQAPAERECWLAVQPVVKRVSEIVAPSPAPRRVDLTPVPSNAREWWTIVVVRDGAPHTIAFEKREQATRWERDKHELDRPVMRLVTTVEPQLRDDGLRYFPPAQRNWKTITRSRRGGESPRGVQQVLL